MEVTEQMIGQLANLSRLSFSLEETKAFKNDLQGMIAFVEKLQEVDTSGVAPLQHMGDAVNVFREDELQGSIDRKEALKNSPVIDDTFFKVPKVIKK